MRCRTCQLSFRGGTHLILHHWQKGQCYKCHYFKNRHVRRFHGDLTRGEGLRSRKLDVRPKMIQEAVTKDNIDLYVKVKKIIMGKTVNPLLVLNNRHNKMLSNLNAFKKKTEESEYDEPEGRALT